MVAGDCGCVLGSAGVITKGTKVRKHERGASARLAPTGRRPGGRGHGGDPVLGGTRLVFFFFLGDVSSFFAQVERGPFGSLPTSLFACAVFGNSLSLELRFSEGRSGTERIG